MAEPPIEPATETPPPRSEPPQDDAPEPLADAGPQLMRIAPPVSIAVTGLVLGLWISLAVVVLTPAVWPILLGTLGLAGWVTLTAWRPKLTLLRIWLLLAAVGAVAGSARYYVRDADRRVREVRAAWERVSTRHNLPAHPQTERLRRRARLGDALAVDRLRERVVRQDHGWFDEARMRWLEPRARAHLPGSEPLDVRSRLRAGPPVPAPPAERGVASSIGAVLGARDRERRIAHAIDALARYEELLARHHAAAVARYDDLTGRDGAGADARFVWKGKYAPRSGAWKVAEGTGAPWPGPYPYYAVAHLPPDLADMVASDWIVALEKAGAPLLDRALIYLERGRAEPAIPLLRRAREEALEAGDRAAEAEAELWLLLAEHRTPQGEITKIDYQGWPAAVAQALRILHGQLTYREQQELGPQVLTRLQRAFGEHPADSPHEAAHPRRVVIIETYVRLEVILRPDEPLDRPLVGGMLEEIRPELAKRIRTPRLVGASNRLVWNQTP